MTTHTFATTLTWTGSTGAGYRRYSRAHQVVPRGAAGIAVSADAAFLGDPALANPEQLLLAAASSCQLLSFLAVAARGGVDVVSCTDGATAVLSGDRDPVRLTRIALRPVIAVRGASTAAVEQLVRAAHDGCYVANSLAVPVDVEPVVRTVP